MEQQQGIHEDQELLSASSEMRWKVQNQLYAFIIGRFEDDIEGHHAELQNMTSHENPYAFFIIDEISRKFASWFDTLCLSTTVQSFAEQYMGQPAKVLEELLGPGKAEQYLRELEERFKVSLAPHASQEIPAPRESFVRSVAGETQEHIMMIIDSNAPAKSA